MDIEALIFDLDGTAIKSTQTALPSQRLISAISKAREYTKIACATGRIVQDAKPVIQKLGLTSPCIIAGGSQIIDPFSFLPVWEKTLERNTIQKILELVLPNNFYVRGSNDPSGVLATQYTLINDHNAFFVSRIYMDELNTLLPKLKEIPNITVHYTPSWEEGKYTIQITPFEASKKKALEEWLRVENIHPKKVMAIGDANNDLPLFEIAGFKVAMGNASEELKSNADWIAPTIDEDGLAITIEKYILNEKE